VEIAMKKKVPRRIQAAVTLFAFLFNITLLNYPVFAEAPGQTLNERNKDVMQISKNGSRTVNVGSSDFFTGKVLVEPLAQGADPARVSAGKVTFEPGARSAWHTHPLGQMLIITDGCGAVQCWGQPLQIVRAGDVIWTPPGVKHWHGALPSAGMTHIAVQESLNGNNVEWKDHVSDEQYLSGLASCAHGKYDEGDVSPALEKYDREVISKLWARPVLTARDRNVVTLSALIAKNQTVELPFYLNFALDNGVEPREISEIITHLAFYSGWSNAIAAVNIAKKVFADRKIKQGQLALASPELLPINEESEKTRAAHVEEHFGDVAPGVIEYTTNVLFRDLWLRPDLKPRDRSLVTVSALIANGQVAQIPYHLNRAMDNGLTQPQASEVLTHLAFYVGWPNVFSALPVAKEVFDKRTK
jgi:4-carboxymuconolactone decarboxylase